MLHPVSSSMSRSATTGGDLSGYENGKIPTSALCAISWQTVDHLRCDAAARLEALNKAYKARYGANICVNDAYRSYAKQVALYEELGPNVAAVPGTSNHGWGIAVDLGCGVGIFGNARHVWFAVNAPKYGFTQPEWALLGSSRAEAWHWQFFGADLPAYLTTTKSATVVTTVVDRFVAPHRQGHHQQEDHQRRPGRGAGHHHAPVGDRHHGHHGGHLQDRRRGQGGLQASTRTPTRS